MMTSMPPHHCMTHRAPQDHRRGPWLALLGALSGLIAALIICLLSVGAPVTLFGIPGLTVRRHNGHDPIASPISEQE